MKLTELFQLYLSQQQVVELQNANKQTVAVIYPNKIDPLKIILQEVNLEEKYYIYLGGVAVFFSYFRKIEEYNI